jgi:hypothetical protein
MNSKSKAFEAEISKERLAYTIYHILREFDSEKKGYITLTRFNKLAYLIHKDIKESYGINTGLPWHWHLFGTVVELKYCPSSTYSVRGSEAGRRLFFNEEPRTRFLSEEERDHIGMKIWEWSQRFTGTREAIDKVYSDVEIPFLREIKQFSDLVSQLRVEKARAETSSSGILKQLDRMIETYPADLFGEVLPIYLRLDNTLRALTEARPEEIKKHAALIEHFRELIVSKASVILSENMPEDWLAQKTDEWSQYAGLYRREYEEAEQLIFSEEWMRKEDRTGYAKKLMEVSWQMFQEG